MNKQTKKSAGQLNEETAFAPPQSVAEVMAIFDKWADEVFAEEHGIKVEDVPAFIAKMRGEG